MKKYAGKTRIWLGVWNIKVWNLNYFSTNRNTTIWAWYTLVINGTCFKFLPKWTKKIRTGCVCVQGWEHWVSRWKTKVLEKHFLILGNMLPRTEECELVSYLWMMSLLCRQLHSKLWWQFQEFTFLSLPISFSSSLVYCSKRRAFRKKLIFAEPLQQAGTVLYTFMNGNKLNPKDIRISD